jgi:dTDP-glucose 4,6-dehydratase
MNQTIVVTGWAGFIGSNFLLKYVRLYPDIRWINVDMITYAGNLDNLTDIANLPNYKHYHVDICDIQALTDVYEQEHPTDVIHFAAESHVDNSIANPSIFLQTNVIGTNNLLLLHKQHSLQRFHYISTDEVYGDLPLDQPLLKFTESTPINPSSPYSTSKTGWDLLTLANHRTYGLDVVVTRCSNNYGPRQHDEKFIPTIIRSILHNKQIPVYGKWINVRDWIHVLDHCDGVRKVFRQASSWSVYNLWWNHELTNIAIVKQIVSLMKADDNLISFVADRPGHDLRYAIDSTKALLDLWRAPQINFQSGLSETIDRYTSKYLPTSRV